MVGIGTVSAAEKAVFRAVVIADRSAGVNDEFAMLPTTPLGLLNTFCRATSALRHDLL